MLVGVPVALSANQKLQYALTTKKLLELNFNHSSYMVSGHYKADISISPKKKAKIFF